MIAMAVERRAMRERYLRAYQRRGFTGLLKFNKAKEGFALANAGICAAVPGTQGKSKAWLAQWKEAHRRVIARIGELGTKSR